MAVASLATSSAGWASKATDSCCFVFIWSSSLSFGQPSSLTCDYRHVGHFSTRCCHAMPDRSKRLLLKIDDRQRDIGDPAIEVSRTGRTGPAGESGGEGSARAPSSLTGPTRFRPLPPAHRAGSAAGPSTAPPPRRGGRGGPRRPL